MTDYHIFISELIHRAETARAAAYTPYSHFSVGAALLCRNSFNAETSPAHPYAIKNDCVQSCAVDDDSMTSNDIDDDPVRSRIIEDDTAIRALLADIPVWIVTGCNIENKAYGSSMCAERTAVFRAIAEGLRDFCAIAIVGGPEGGAPLDYCAPCGACRQVLSEFVPPDFPVILAKNETDYKIYTLAELLPEAFSFARTDVPA